MALTSPGNVERKLGVSTSLAALEPQDDSLERKREGRVDRKERYCLSLCSPRKVERAERKKEIRTRQKDFGSQVLVLLGDEPSQSSECSALLLSVLCSHTGSWWEERLQEHKVHLNPPSLIPAGPYCFTE